MSLVSRDPILLTPGPLTTSLATKAAMLRDWGSWDAAFNAVTARVRKRLLDVVNATTSHVCVPMQGSGTFSVEAAVNTLVPRDGHVLVLINGAYGHAHGEADVDDGPQDVDVRHRGRRADDRRRRRPAARPPTRRSRHVGLIHCETSTGIHNPLAADRAGGAAPRAPADHRRDELVRRAARSTRGRSRSTR